MALRKINSNLTVDPVEINGAIAMSSLVHPD
jgi:hypothetical protein